VLPYGGKQTEPALAVVAGPNAMAASETSVNNGGSSAPAPDASHASAPAGAASSGNH
jgi:hypothetical protein